MFHLERQLRDCYNTEIKVEYDGFFYKLERFKANKNEEITFGKFKSNGEPETIVRDFSKLEEDEYDLEKEELIQLLLKTKRQLQRSTDTLRIERKAWRLENRKEQHALNLLDDILAEVPKCKIEKTNNIIKIYNNSIIIQLSDLHIGEVVELHDNKFNFEIAKKRLTELFNEAISFANKFNTNNITILFTGDTINLDSHMDKKITNEASRSKALIKAFEILSSCIDMLIDKKFYVSIGGIVGNEGRLNGYEKFSSVDEIALDNFDYLLFNMINARFSKQIKLINNCDSTECMVNINGKNIILVHGDKIKHNDLHNETIKLKQRWYEKTGVMADYVLLGHIHSHRVEPTFARSGSLVGANSYSDNGLNIPSSVASQNILIINDRIMAIPITLN